MLSYITYWITSNVSVTAKKSASFGRGLSVISQPNTLHVSEWVYGNVGIKCTCSCMLYTYTFWFSFLIPNLHVATGDSNCYKLLAVGCTLTRAAWILLHINRYCAQFSCRRNLPTKTVWFWLSAVHWSLNTMFLTTWECLHSYTLLVQAWSTHPSFFSGLWGLAIRASMMI